MAKTEVIAKSLCYTEHMLRSRGGYTIIEVSIVLMITTVLFASAITVFQGQQGKTVFSQSLYDLASQIQSYASQVNSGVYPNSQDYDCRTVVSGGTTRPYLVQASPSGAPNCLYLGRALQVTTAGTLAAYTVLGVRVDSSGNIVDQFDNAAPTPALNLNGARGAAGAVWYLYDQYKLPTGHTFTASKTYNQTGGLATRYMVGFYTDLAGNSSNALSVRGYNLSPATAIASSATRLCIEQNSPCNTYTSVRKWELCVKNGSHIGSVTVTTTPSGVATNVNALECT